MGLWRLRGLDTLQAQLADLGEELAGKAAVVGAREAFRPVLDTAKAMVPRDTGALAEALTMGTAKMNGGVAVGIIVGKGRALAANIAAAAFGEAQIGRLPPARRWHFIEFGTSRQPPQPFLRPAIDQGAEGVLARLQTTMNKSIQRVASRKGKGGGK
jgi:HK97 gp10 family phage protein